MSDFKLNSSTWDIDINAIGDIDLVSGAQQTTQNSRFRLQIIAGECFDDTRIGMPWLTDMVNPQVSVAAKKQIIRDVILSTPNAVSVDSLVVAFDNSDNSLAVCTFKGTASDGEEFSSTIITIDNENNTIEAENLVDENGYPNQQLWYQLTRMNNSVQLNLAKSLSGLKNG